MSLLWHDTDTKFQRPNTKETRENKNPRKGMRHVLIFHSHCVKQPFNFRSQTSATVLKIPLSRGTQCSFHIVREKISRTPKPSFVRFFVPLQNASCCSSPNSSQRISSIFSSRNTSFCRCKQLSDYVSEFLFSQVYCALMDELL
jgi:hypothetical protein